MGHRTVRRAPGGRGFAAACAALLALATSPAFGGTILQPSGAYEFNVNFPFAVNAIGQVIKVPTNGDTELISFAIAIAVESNSRHTTMTGELYAWDGTKATGPNLFQSPLTQISPVTFTATPTPIFDTGGIDLVAGGQYVVFVSSTPQSADFLSHLINGTGTGYPDGPSVYIESSDPSVWTTQNWIVGVPNSDQTDLPQLNFVADFVAPAVAVPEPSGLLLLTLGAGCVGVVRTIRARRSR
jgi:hypothetical protein